MKKNYKRVQFLFFCVYNITREQTLNTQVPTNYYTLILTGVMEKHRNSREYKEDEFLPSKKYLLLSTIFITNNIATLSQK